MTQTHGVKLTADENETYATQIKNKNNNGIKKVSAPFARGALLELFSNSTTYSAVGIDPSASNFVSICAAITQATPKPTLLITSAIL